MIQYGLISKVDSQVLEKTIDLIMSEFPKDELRLTEVGLFDCMTAWGIANYIVSKDGARPFEYFGIDNHKDKEIQPPWWMNFIYGNSNEVYNRLPDNSQHLIFIDGNHSFPYVVSDYYCYKNKVKKGGYLCFHDTAPQAQGRDWQRIGSEDDSDMCISVEKALQAVGILPTPRKELNRVAYWTNEWKLVFDEYDPLDGAGGICVFKKL